MYENKIVYLDKITSSQKEFNDLISKDPSLLAVDQKAADEYVKNLGCSFITILSPLYPNSLKLQSAPPWVLYYGGNLNLLKYETIGILGCDVPNKMGLKITSEIMRNFESSKSVVTELRHGICNQAIISGLVHQKHAIVLVDSVEELVNGGYFVKKIINSNIVVTPNVSQLFPKHDVDSFVSKMANETIQINLGEYDKTIAKKNF